MIALRWLWIPLTLLGIIGIVYGVSTGQMSDVAVHAGHLCLDCIGLGGN